MDCPNRITVKNSLKVSEDIIFVGLRYLQSITFMGFILLLTALLSETILYVRIDI